MSRYKIEQEGFVATSATKNGFEMEVAWGDKLEDLCGDALRSTLRRTVLPSLYTKVDIDVSKDPYIVEFMATRATTTGLSHRQRLVLNAQSLALAHKRVCDAVTSTVQPKFRPLHLFQNDKYRSKSCYTTFYLGSTHGLVARRAVREVTTPRDLLFRKQMHQISQPRRKSPLVPK